jgi:hypothetical protein
LEDYLGALDLFFRWFGNRKTGELQIFARIGIVIPITTAQPEGRSGSDKENWVKSGGSTWTIIKVT